MSLIACGTAMLVGLSSFPLNPAQRPKPSAPLRLVVDRRIGGAAETRDAYIFTDVRGLALTSRNEVIVADNAAHEVRMFAPDGAHRWTIGGRGQGPGDFQGPCCIATDPTGALWVRDFGNRRFVAYDVTGARPRLIRTIQGLANPTGTLDRIAWARQNQPIDIATPPGPPNTRVSFVRAVADSSGAPRIIDTLKGPPPDSLESYVVSNCAGGAECGVSVYQRPHGARSLIAFGNNGEYALAVSSSYSVSWFDRNGRRRALLRAAANPPRLSDEERASAERLLNDIAGRIKVARSALPLSVPEQKAPLVAIGFDLDGRLWVQRAVGANQPRRADIYDRSGRLIASAEWPANVSLSLWTVRGWNGVGVERDSDGVLSVIRFRLVP